MKKVLVSISLIGLGFLLAWAISEDSSQLKAELQSLNTELQQLKTDIGKTENERDELKVKIAVERRSREQLQEQVNELTGSREKLQKQVEEFIFSRDQSQQQLAEIVVTRDNLKKQLAEVTASRNRLSRQVNELTRSRDTAVRRAKTAQERVDILMAMVNAKKKGSGGQQDQDELAVINQAKADTEPPIIEVSRSPDVLTDISWPAVVPSQVDERPVCQSFNTTRPRIMPGQSSTLSWQVSNAERVRIEPGIGPVSALGSKAVNPSKTTTYTLIAANKSGQSRITCKVKVGDSPTIQKQYDKQPAVITEVIKPPVISGRLDGRPACHSFSTTRPRIMPGQSSTLSWQVSNAERIRIEPGIGPVSALGSRTVNPSKTTTYTLIAANKAGQSRLSCRVEINERITIFSTDTIHPRVLLEEDKTSGDSKVLPGQKPPSSDPNAMLGKFIGYRARTDESGKFVFIPVYENKKEENKQEE